jgi:uncharacterized SAM-binding protein YcdF (DUF218 family)
MARSGGPVPGDSALSSRQQSGSPAGRARRRWVALVMAFFLGAASVPAAGYVIDHTRYADVLVAPLLRSDTDGEADVIVALSGSVTRLCTPNLYSIRRVLLAARLYREGRAPLILFSGGVPEGVSCSVAEVMASLARDLGIPAERIRVETRSRSTWENALFSAPILRAAGAGRILLVTDSLHMPRAEASFAQFGFQIERASVPVAEGQGGNVTMLWLGFREYVAILHYRIKGRIDSRSQSIRPASDRFAHRNRRAHSSGGPLLSRSRSKYYAPALGYRSCCM